MFINFVLSSIFIIISTIILNLLPNKSNFNKLYIIPIISSILSKYIIGDWDLGYNYTFYDLLFWIYNLLLSFVILYNII